MKQEIRLLKGPMDGGVTSSPFGAAAKMNVATIIHARETPRPPGTMNHERPAMLDAAPVPNSSIMVFMAMIWALFIRRCAH